MLPLKNMFDFYGGFMKQKDLKKIKRKELLELLLAQAQRIKELEIKLTKACEDLNSKKIKIKESGSIAEASLKLNKVFESTQLAADQYLDNFKDNCKKMETAIKKETMLEKNKIIKESEEKCKKLESELEEKIKKYDDLLSKTKAKPNIKRVNKSNKVSLQKPNIKRKK